ncbi:hypothetical protein J4466_05275 [Candidatus Pacearchaeota archaeon]|nr:hypothetical protein [Candidatus Pacearchaeota archaeon]
MLTREEIVEGFFRETLTGYNYDPEEVISVLQQIQQIEPEVYGIKAILNERNKLQVGGCYTGLKEFSVWGKECYKKLQTTINGSNWAQKFSTSVDIINIIFKLPKSNQSLEIVIEESEIHE